MKKINLSAFTVKMRTPDGTEKDINYGIKESIIDMLYNPALKLNSINLLKQEILAKKVLESGDDLLLEEEEYSKLSHALSVIEGLGKNDIEMVHRIVDAPDVAVEVKA